MESDPHLGWLVGAGENVTARLRFEWAVLGALAGFEVENPPLGVDADAHASPPGKREGQASRLA